MKRMNTDDRQEQIIEAAVKIISRAGFQAFTTRTLAELVGITEPALYRHFKNKDEILAGIIKKLDDLWSDVEERLGKIEDYAGKLSSLMKMHFDYFQANPDVVSILFADEYIRWNDQVSGYLREVQGKRYNYLVNLFTEGIKSQVFREYSPNVVSLIILGSLRSTVQNWRNSEGSFSLSDKGDEVIQTLLKMVLWCGDECE